MRQYISEAKELLESTNDTDISLKIDKEAQQKKIIADSVAKAIDHCVANDILRDFFEQHRQEVIDMGILGYTAEGHMEVIREEGYEQGYEQGYDKGYDNGYGKAKKEVETTINDLESEVARLKAELAAKDNK